jgi:hypothetical protein
MIAVSVKAVLPALLVIGAMSPCLAQRANLPKIDLQQLCRENDRIVREVFSDIAQDAVQNCVMGEQEARDQILKDWSTFPAVAKSQCVRPSEYLPSYVEWQACLEMTRDVMNSRKEEAEAGSQGQNTLCPVVKLAKDGSLVWVLACDLNTDIATSHRSRMGNPAYVGTRADRGSRKGERK